MEVTEGRLLDQVCDRFDTLYIMAEALSKILEETQVQSYNRLMRWRQNGFVPAKFAKAVETLTNGEIKAADVVLDAARGKGFLHG